MYWIFDGFGIQSTRSISSAIYDLVFPVGPPSDNRMQFVVPITAWHSFCNVIDGIETHLIMYFPSSAFQFMTSRASLSLFLQCKVSVLLRAHNICIIAVQNCTKKLYNKICNWLLWTNKSWGLFEILIALFSRFYMRHAFVVRFALCMQLWLLSLALPARINLFQRILLRAYLCIQNATDSATLRSWSSSHSQRFGRHILTGKKLDSKIFSLQRKTVWNQSIRSN